MGIGEVGCVDSQGTSMGAEWATSHSFNVMQIAHS